MPHPNFNIGDYKSWYYNNPEFGLERHTPNLQGIATTSMGSGLHLQTPKVQTQVQPQITTGQRLKNAASGVAGILGGIMGGPLGWASLAISAIGDNIRAAKSQFDLNGFRDQLNDAGGDYLRAAGSANTTSDLINLADMRTDFLDDINNQGYQWDGSILGGIGALIGNANTERDKEQARQMQARMSEIESYGMQNALNRVNNNTYRFGLANYLNNAAMGGPLFTHGSDFTDDLIRIDAGGSHESNPMGGVPAGIDPEGVPNLVEEGETIWDNGDEEYVFSKRLKAPKKLVKEFKLGGGKKGLSYSEAARRISEKSGATLRPNDAISKRTKDAMLAELEEHQENKRAQIEKRKLLNELESMSPEELQGLAGMMQQSAMQSQMPPQGMEMQPLSGEPMAQEPVQGEGMYEPIGISALGGKLFEEGGPAHQVGTPKEKNGTAWGTYTLPGVQRFFNNLIEEYQKATTEDARAAIRKRAIDTVNKIQTGYRDIYNEFNGKTARYSDAVKAHQQAFADAGGNYGFAGGEGIVPIDETINYGYTGRTDDNASGNFSPDGLYGWRTFLRNFGSTASGDLSSGVSELADKLDLDWTPTIDYGNEGNRLYTLSERVKGTPQGEPWVPQKIFGISTVNPVDLWKRQSPMYNIPGQGTPAKPSEEPAAKTTPKYKELATWMRYAPIVGSGLSVLGNLFSNPDYSEYQGLINAAKRIGRPVAIPVETIGNRLRRNPFDERLAVNQANQNYLASLRGTMDTSGGNRAYRQAASNILAYNNQGALTDIANKSYLANRQDALQTADFNRGTDMFNANAINQRNLAQAQLNSNRRQAGFNALLGAQNALDNARRWDEQFVDADLTGFLQGLGDLGRENFIFNQINSRNREGLSPVRYDAKTGTWIFDNQTAACGGKIKTKKRRF